MKRFLLDRDQFLAYADIGSSTGHHPPVLLLHGGGVDHRMRVPQLHAFPNHRVIAPDARGHGASSTPADPYRRVDDVVALLDGLDLDAVVAVGLSMGAATGIDLAVEYPDRVRRLV
ncbi:hypothetical protein GCM10022261_00330 [Brevibacterium daeguense]|uniref:AB hydrolase-1 domain-containing protein n=1 Tax=Brevibacterium daeguense TaxID=909936 RepID=A0ABP8EET3_9MICO